MACFFCKTINARVCRGSCGLCGSSCPGYVPDGAPNGMNEEDYTLKE